MEAHAIAGSRKMLRVLVLVQGTLGDRLSGPEIRGWEIVRAFAGRHQVTALAFVSERTTREGITVAPYTRRNLIRELDRHDVVIGPVIPPYALFGNPDCIRVADLYDPVALELGTLGGWKGRHMVRQQERMRMMNLCWSDIVLGANERQLEGLRADLGSTRRADAPPLLSVPMGLPDPSPAPVGNPLRERFEGIGRTDPIVLWWGSVWRWLDAETAVKAIGVLAERKPDVRMVITAGRPANAATDPLNVTEEVREIARDRGLLDRNVFFLDEWVPFERRNDYLSDATVGITLHADTAEAPLAARARYMDCVWASLPLVLARGDEVAERLAEAGAATLVPPRDPVATAAAIDALISDQARLEAAREASRRVAREFHWSTLLEPLVATVEEHASTSTRSAGRLLRLSADAGRFYAGQAVERVLVSSGAPER
jgi:glycosyltransferase involved in cell wall biosynthesis